MLTPQESVDCVLRVFSQRAPSRPPSEAPPRSRSVVGPFGSAVRQIVAVSDTWGSGGGGGSGGEGVCREGAGAAKQRAAEEAAAVLVDVALERGSLDNISAAVLLCGEG